MKNINNYDTKTLSQADYIKEYENEMNQRSFAEIYFNICKQSTENGFSIDIEKWLSKRFSSDAVIKELYGIYWCCFDRADGEVKIQKERFFKEISETFEFGRFLRGAWSYAQSVTKRPIDHFMRCWIPELKYSKNREHNFGLFKKSVEFFDQTNYIIVGRFLEMAPVHVLVHRMKIMNKAVSQTVSKCSMNYGSGFLRIIKSDAFQKLSRGMFMNLPQFHNWARGVASCLEHFKDARYFDHFTSKHYAVLGRLSPRCREYVVTCMKSIGDRSMSAKSITEYIDNTIIDWQKLPSWKKRMPCNDGKRRFLSFAKKYMSKDILDCHILNEYYKSNLFRLDLLRLNKCLKDFFLGLEDMAKFSGRLLEHAYLGWYDLCAVLGNQARAYVEKHYGAFDTYKIHDAAQPFSECRVLSKSWISFIMKYGNEAAKLQAFSDEIKEPKSISAVKELISCQAYGIGSKEVQRACYECKFSKCQVGEYLEWLKNHPNKTSESCPHVDIELDGYRFFKLASDDVRGPLLGIYTDCCQHPRSAGRECAAHGWESPDGAFYVVEHKGRIIGQSWAWRGEYECEHSITPEGEIIECTKEHSDTLCFDNIELLNNEAYGPVVFKLYQEAAKRIVGRLGIKRVTVGLGYNDLEELRQLPDDTVNDSPDNYDGYRDSRHQKVFYSTMKEDNFYAGAEAA